MTGTVDGGSLPSLLKLQAWLVGLWQVCSQRNPRERPGHWCSSWPTADTRSECAGNGLPPNVRTRLKNWAASCATLNWALCVPRPACLRIICRMESVDTTVLMPRRAASSAASVDLPAGEQRAPGVGQFSSISITPTEGQGAAQATARPRPSLQHNSSAANQICLLALQLQHK